MSLLQRTAACSNQTQPAVAPGAVLLPVSSSSSSAVVASSQREAGEYEYLSKKKRLVSCWSWGIRMISVAERARWLLIRLQREGIRRVEARWGRHGVPWFGLEGKVNEQTNCGGREGKRGRRRVSKALTMTSATPKRLAEQDATEDSRSRAPFVLSQLNRPSRLGPSPSNPRHMCAGARVGATTRRKGRRPPARGCHKLRHLY